MVQMSSSHDQEFKTGWPRYPRSEGGAIEFEVKLAQRGEIPAGTVIKAVVDDSQQYQADGRCWRAISSCHMVEIGQRLEKEHVIGWREISARESA